MLRILDHIGRRAEEGLSQWPFHPMRSLLVSNRRTYCIGLSNVIETASELDIRAHATATHLFTFDVSDKEEQRGINRDFFYSGPATTLAAMLYNPSFHPEQVSCLVVILLTQHYDRATHKERCYYVHPNLQ